MRSVVVVVVCLLGLGLGLATAVASPKPDAATRKKAAAHFKQGEAFFQTGQYPEAVAEYEAAWALTPEPLIRFNIALALEREGDLDGALAEFKRYLDLDPDGKVADEAREDVAQVTAQIDAQKAAKAKADADADAKAKADADAKAKAKADADAKAKAEQARRDEEARAKADEERTAEQAAHAHAHAHAHRTWLTWSGVATAAIGAALAGYGAYEGRQAKSDSDALSAHTTGAWTSDLLAKQSAGRLAEHRFEIFSLAGGGTLLGGIALFLVGVF